MASDLLVGAVWIAIAAVLWWPPRTRRSALLAAAFGVTWLAGSVDASLVFLHRGPLAHLLLAYPAGRLVSTPARAAVALAYASAFTDWSLAFALGLVAAVAVRWLTATGVVRRSRLVPLLTACGVGAVLSAGALGAEHVLLAYEVVLVLAGVAIAADLRAASWSSGSITGLVVDLGRHGSVRERLRAPSAIRRSMSPTSSTRRQSTNSVARSSCRPTARASSPRWHRPGRPWRC